VKDIVRGLICDMPYFQRQVEDAPVNPMCAEGQYKFPNGTEVSLFEDSRGYFYKTMRHGNHVAHTQRVTKPDYRIYLRGLNTLRHQEKTKFLWLLRARINQKENSFVEMLMDL